MAVVAEKLGFKEKKQEKGLQDVGISSIHAQWQKERRADFTKFKTNLKKYSIITDYAVKENTKVRLTPEEKMEYMIEGMYLINETIQDISVPFGGGGTVEWYAKALVAWSELYTLLLNGATATLDLIKKMDLKNSIDPSQSKRDEVNKYYRTWYQLIFIDCAQVMYGYSWDKFNLDWAVVVNQPPATSSRYGEDLANMRNPNEDVYGGKE